MANVTVDNAVHASFGLQMHRSLVWTSSLVGYSFFLGALAANVYYRKTTDGGATWGNRVTVYTGTANIAAIWYDQWTPGDDGTKIHVAWVASTGTTIRYVNLETASDTLGTEEQVAAFTAVGGAPIVIGRFPVSIVKARGGNLYIIFATSSSAAGNLGFYRSTDAGDNWTSRSDAALEQSGGFYQVDQCLMVPGSEADTNDIWCLYWDVSANEISVKVHDDSANTWAETVVISSVTDAASVGDAQKQ
jgi:hypothetical protein